MNVHRCIFQPLLFLGVMAFYKILDTYQHHALAYYAITIHSLVHVCGLIHSYNLYIMSVMIKFAHKHTCSGWQPICGSTEYSCYINGSVVPVYYTHTHICSHWSHDIWGNCTKYIQEGAHSYSVTILNHLLLHGPISNVYTFSYLTK